MSSKGVCAGCRGVIEGQDFLKCNKCLKISDLPCANILDRKQYVSMSRDQKFKWVYHECRSKQPKVGNTSSPVRNLRDEESSTLSGIFGAYEDGSENVTSRMKPPCIQRNSSDSPISPGLTAGREEIFISAISERVLEVLRTELPQLIAGLLKKELAPIKKDLLEFRESLNFLSEKHDDLNKTIESLVKDNRSLMKENNALKTTVSELSGRLNNLEQHLRENNLEIQVVPEHHNENLTNILMQCSRVVGHDLKDDDVIKCTRVARINKNSKLPRAIIVKFRSVRIRDDYYSAVHRYNKANPNEKLNIALLGIAGEKKPIYVSEHLSPMNKSLHASARKKARELGYQFVLVRNGRIFVKKAVDSTQILIGNVESINLIR